MPVQMRSKPRKRRLAKAGSRSVTAGAFTEARLWALSEKNEAAPAADTASTGSHRVTRYWFLRRFTAVAYLWRPTLARTAMDPGERISASCDGPRTLSRGLFSQHEFCRSKDN